MTYLDNHGIAVKEIERLYVENEQLRNALKQAKGNQMADTQKVGVSGILGGDRHPLDEHIDALRNAADGLASLKQKLVANNAPLNPDSNQFNPDSPSGRFPTRSPRPNG